MCYGKELGKEGKKPATKLYQKRKPTKKQPNPQKHKKSKKATQTLITSHHMLMQFVFAAGSALLICRARLVCVLLTVLWPLL